MHHNAHRLLILRNARKQHEKHGHVEIELAPRLHPCTNKNGNSSNGGRTNNKNGPEQNPDRARQQVERKSFAAKRKIVVL